MIILLNWTETWECKNQFPIFLPFLFMLFSKSGFLFFFQACQYFSVKTSGSGGFEKDGSATSKKMNKLGTEKSPYLLQHATNPVHWFPWGEEAFAAARESNKLIFLSVGYSTCHWCHVMERESFESEEVSIGDHKDVVCLLLHCTAISVSLQCTYRKSQ